MNKAHRWILLVGLFFLTPLLAGAFQPFSLSDDALALATAFEQNVQPLLVTFEVTDTQTNESITQTLTRTAVAVLSDESGTYWLTVPGALAYPGAGLLELPFQSIQLADSNAALEVLTVVDDFRGAYVILREDQNRLIPQVPLGILLPPFHDQTVGMVYIAEKSDFTERVVATPFQPVKDSFSLPGRDIRGFRFDIPVIVRDSAIGAPVFHRTVDPFTGEVGFALVGMVIDTTLEDLPLFTQSAIDVPHSFKVFEVINPEGAGN